MFCVAFILGQSSDRSDRRWSTGHGDGNANSAKGPFSRASDHSRTVVVVVVIEVAACMSRAILRYLAVESFNHANEESSCFVRW